MDAERAVVAGAKGFEVPVVEFAPEVDGSRVREAGSGEGP